MRKLLLLVFMFLIACTPLPKGPDYRIAPDIPALKTSKGRECAMQCQRDHSLCNDGCQRVVAFDHSSMKQRNWCFWNCNKKLDQCYQLCLEDEKSPKD